MTSKGNSSSSLPNQLWTVSPDVSYIRHTSLSILWKLSHLLSLVCRISLSPKIPNDKLWNHIKHFTLKTPKRCVVFINNKLPLFTVSLLWQFLWIFHLNGCELFSLAPYVEPSSGKSWIQFCPLIHIYIQVWHSAAGEQSSRACGRRGAARQTGLQRADDLSPDSYRKCK